MTYGGTCDLRLERMYAGKIIEYAAGIMTPSALYDWGVKCAEKREGREMEVKKAVYREEVAEDALVLGRSKDIGGLRNINPMACLTGNLAGKAYELPRDLHLIPVDKWLIAKDDRGILCLIPRKKKGE